MYGAIGEYYDAILDGTIIAPYAVTEVYRRLIANLDAGRCFFDATKANHIISFATTFIRHSKGKWAGKKVRLELWQRAMLSAIFGVVDEDGNKVHSECLLVVGRKCGKSFLSCIIALYCLLTEAGSEVYIASTKLDQSMHTFNQIVDMINMSPYLKERINHRKRWNDLYCPSRRGIIKPIGSRHQSSDGLNGSCIICDEIHAWKGDQGRKLYEVLRQSTSARENPVVICTTTAGFERFGIYDQLYEMSMRIVAGEMELPTFLPLIYSVDDEAEVWAEPDAVTDDGIPYVRAWAKANPNLHVSKSVEYLVNSVARAKAVDLERPGVLTKDFCLPQNSVSAWLELSDIGTPEEIPLEKFKTGWNIAGVDLSITTDLTAACIIRCEDGEIYCHSMAWIPSETLRQHEESDQVPYAAWIKRGLVRVCQGTRINPSDVAQWFRELVTEHGIDILQVGFDPYCSQYFVDEMQHIGFVMDKVRQGAQTLCPAMDSLGADIRAGKLHYDSPVLQWCLSNVSVEQNRNGGVLPVKSDRHKRIDVFAALLCAFVTMDRNRARLGW